MEDFYNPIFNFDPMKLIELFSEYPESWDLVFPSMENQVQFLNLEIKNIVSDSRNVKKGDLFVAIKGLNFDGNQFICDAIEHGAIAVCGSDPLALYPVPFIRVVNPRNAFAYLVAAMKDYPAKKLTVIGVTGTDGKTTTATFIYHILQTAGYTSGLISTVSAKIGDQEIDTGFHVTTPEAPQIQTLLEEMIYHTPNPISHVVIETTSHGLAQRRVAACYYDIGVFTNVTHEHLDFHGTYDEYLKAKASLIYELKITPEKENGNYRIAIINKDDQAYSYLNEQVIENKLSAISYAINTDADITAIDIDKHSSTPKFVIKGLHKTEKIELNLIGLYNIYNALAAWGATAEALNIETEAVVEGLKQVKFIPGRMEPIDIGQNFLALFQEEYSLTKRGKEITFYKLMNVLQ